MRTPASWIAVLAALLAACTPTPPPPAPASTPSPSATSGAAATGPKTVMVNGKPIPAELLVVPPDPISAYRNLYQGEGETAQEGGTIIRHLESECNSLNPVLQTELYEAFVEWYIFDPLVAYDNKLDVVGVVAERWEWSADHMALDMDIRHGIKWHDGQPLTAKDVCFTFDMILDPKVPAINVRAGIAQIKNCEVVADDKVRLHMKAPFAAQVALMNALFIIPEHVYRVKDTALFNKQPANRTPIGSGPWKFDKWEAQSKIVLKRNEDYWGPKPKPDTTVFKIIDNRETALKAAAAGELDEQRVPKTKWVTDIATPAYDDFNKVLWYTFSLNYYGLSNKDPMFADKRVRQAIAMADDRKSIIRDLYHGLAEEISAPFCPQSEWYDKSVEPWPFDLARAAKLLEEAGWKDTNGDGTIDKDGKEFDFELLYPSGNTISEQTGAIYQQNLGKLGIKMTLRALEGATFFERVNKGEFQACTLAWQADPDPEGYLVLVDSRLAPPVGTNHDFYKNPEVDKLIDAERLEFDHAKRVELVHQIHKLLKEDVPMVASLSIPETYIMRKSIRGIQVNTLFPTLVFPGGAQWWLVQGRGAAAPR